MRDYKVTVRHYANTHLRPRFSDIQEDNKRYYPLYMLIIYMRKNTQIRSTIKAWVSAAGAQELVETGRPYDDEYIANDIEDIGKEIVRERQQVVGIIEAWKKVVGKDVPIPFGDIDFPKLMAVASLSAREYTAAVIWQYAKLQAERCGSVRIPSFIDGINTHYTLKELQSRCGRLAPSLPYDVLTFWDSVQRSIPEDVDIFEWYAKDLYIGEELEKLLTEAIRKTLTTDCNGIY